MRNAASDQKLTIDLSPSRTARIPAPLGSLLDPTGLGEVLSFFGGVEEAYVVPAMETLSALAGADLGAVHKGGNFSYRLCDYNINTKDPLSENGCGAHTDYGTFSIIFQDGTPGLETEEEDAGTQDGDIDRLIWG